MALVASRFEVWLIALDPTRGSEIQKTRPCLIISPDEMNHHISTVIVAPMTTRRRSYPSRVPLIFRKKRGEIVLDQIRTVDKVRLVKKLGEADSETGEVVLGVLQEMFAK